jgi:hemolysin activation/secretion protein
LTQVVIPPQTIDNGIVRFQIVEGFIDTIDIQAPKNESESALKLIRKYADGISGSTAVNIAQLERGLLLINDLPGVSARSILSPSETTPGAADLLVIIERDTFDSIVTTDNFGSRYLGAVQLGTAATYRSLFGVNDSITAQMVYAPGTGYELLFGSLAL